MTFALSFVLTVIDWSDSKREMLWAADNLDAAVATALASAILIGITYAASALLRPRSTETRQFLRGFVRWIGVGVLVISAFATYASFRNQARLFAEAALDDSSYGLYDIEMANPKIRCLYYNYGYDHTRCLEAIVANEESWSFALFYVEEALFILEQAQKDRAEWGSTYAEQIGYWAQDVSRDRTGMFSYYLISTAGSEDSAKATMVAADVSINHLCDGFRKVWDALEARAAQPLRVSGAAKDCARRLPIKHSILAAAILPLEE